MLSTYFHYLVDVDFVPRHLMPGDSITIRHSPGDGECVCPEGLTVSYVTFGNNMSTTFECHANVTVYQEDFFPDHAFDAYRDDLLQFREYRDMLLKRYRQS